MHKASCTRAIMYVTNMFDREDGTAHIYQQFKVKRASNDFKQLRYTETRRGCVVTPQKPGTYEHIRHIF